MALNKICRCGKVIPYNKDTCEECSNYKKEAYKQYNDKRTDGKEAAFYSSRPWQIVKQVVKNRDHGLCRVCQSKKEISYIQTVHHIEELKECWSKRLETDNAIGLCESCHMKIHHQYKIGNKSEMQEWLIELAKS